MIDYSAVNHKGDKLFPFEYSADFVEAPQVGQQHRPCLTPSEIENLIDLAKSEQERLLYISISYFVLLAYASRSFKLCASDQRKKLDQHGTTKPQVYLCGHRAFEIGKFPV
jgi:hypothetical protein